MHTINTNTTLYFTITSNKLTTNKIIGDGGIAVDFWIIKVPSDPPDPSGPPGLQDPTDPPDPPEYP